MKAVIVGCGRVGALLADTFDQAGNDVVIIDLKTRAFERLSSGFGGSAVRGDGTDEDVLRRAGADGADIFIALTEGDNRNVMAAQLAVESFGVGRVIAKINDPVRAAAYADLGLATLNRTTLQADAVLEYLGLPAIGAPGVHAPSRNHAHHDGADSSADSRASAPATASAREA
jgi:trk system potassium uptake protein TrkA